MDGLDHSEAFAQPPKLSDQLAGAVGLAGVILVWLCVLPFAALAFCVARLFGAARRAMAPASRA